MTDNTAVATQDEVKAPRAIDTFRANLDKAAATIMPLLPAHITADKFRSMVITTIAYNPKLQECTPTSLLRAVADLAELGLSTNPALKEADIVPVWSKDGMVAQSRPRAIGLVKLARQGGLITKLYTHEVYENDEFTYEYGLDKKLVHKPSRGERGELTFAYCVWKTRDGEMDFEVVDKKRIDRAKSASENYKAYKAGKIKEEYVTWIRDESEMWRKTAVIAAAKYMPKTTETEALHKAISLNSHVNFDDGTPSLGSSFQTEAIAPPRPTRQPHSPAEAQAPPNDEEQRNKSFRDTMADDSVTDATETPAQSTGTPAATGAGTPAGNVDAILTDIRAKIADVKGRQMLGAIEKDYESDILDLPEMARDTIRAEIEARRGELKK